MHRATLFLSALIVCLIPAHEIRAEFGDMLYQFAPFGPEEDRIPYSGQEFGSQVALSETHVLIGAEGDEFHGTETGGSWSFEAVTGKLTASPISDDISEGDSFAEGVAISGSRGVVGADKVNDGAGAAYLFDLTTGAQLFKLRADDQAADWEFGQSVAMNGNRVVVGAEGANEGAGAAYLFDADTGKQLQSFAVEGEAEVGNLTAIWGDVVMAGTDSETAFLFDAATGGVLHKLSVEGSDGFAESIGISDKYAVVGADGVNEARGAVYVFDVESGELRHTLSLADAVEGEEFGKRVAVHGSTITVSAPAEDDDTKTGAVFIYDAVTGHQISRIADPGTETNVQFGSSMSMTADRVLVGAENGLTDVEGISESGTAYLFNINLSELADVNNDDKVDAADIDDLSKAARESSTEPRHDINNDGAVNEMDRTIWIEALVGTYSGDSNLDGEFNSTDLVAVFAGGKYEMDEDASWAQGDWNGDSRFDSGDLVAAFAAGGYEEGPLVGAQAVPEPASILMLVAGLIGITIYRRRIGVPK